MMKIINNIKNKIIKIVEKITSKIIDDEIKNTFKKLIELEIKFKILWIILLPLSLIFVLINGIVIIISITNYIILFIKKLIKIRIFKKKPKNLIYKRRFKFLKNFYIVFLEKILITYPKQKGFLIFYVVSKSIYEKDKSIISKEYLPNFIKSLSNRIVILLIFSVPYIVIYCNTNFIILIRDLNEFNYSSKLAFLDTIIINLLKDLTNDYNKLILKLKIKFFKKKIIFNSKKDLLNALKYKKDFHKDFNVNKKTFKYGLVKHKITDKNFSKSHFTAINNLKNNKIIYSNETTRESLEYYKYQIELKKYIEEQFKNSHIHKGTLNNNKKAFYTPCIETETEKIVLNEGYKNSKLIKNLKEENINNIIASFSINLDQEYLETMFLKIKGINKNVLVQNRKIEKTIDFYKENKDFIDNEQYESILNMNFFWKENEKIVNNLSIEEKINLCKDLNLELNSSAKEINFQIFKNIINKK